MYDIIAQIIDHSWSTGSSEQQYVYYCCISLIVIFAVVFIDMIRDIFRSIICG